MAMSEVTLVSTEERHAVSIQGRVRMSDIPKFVGAPIQRYGWR